MTSPAEHTRLLAENRTNPSGNSANLDAPSFNSDERVERGWNPEPPYASPPPAHRPVDMNMMKRNMSIAKGFMDISLLTANASQLKHVLIYGDTSSYVYYVVIVGLSISLALQIVTGVLLIAKERFDLNVEDDQQSADLYNNITVLLVFLTLLVNVFISSFGISSIHPHQKGGYPPAKQIPSYERSANPIFLSSGGTGNYLPPGIGENQSPNTNRGGNNLPSASNIHPGISESHLNNQASGKESSKPVPHVGEGITHKTLTYDSGATPPKIPLPKGDKTPNPLAEVMSTPTPFLTDNQ